MKAHLLHRDEDWDWQWVQNAADAREEKRSGRRGTADKFDPRRGLPWNREELVADLGLEVLFETMSDGDNWIYAASRKALLSAATTNTSTILYRQAILKDCLENATAVKAMYQLTCEAMQKQKNGYLGMLSNYPDSVLNRAIQEMGVLIEFLRRLRSIADAESPRFAAEGWSTFFFMLQQDVDDGYIDSVQEHLKTLKLHNGTLVGASLGRANKGQDYILHRVPYHRWNLLVWLDELFDNKEPGFSFELNPRDEAGGRALREVENRGVAVAANALAQSVDHVRDFFVALRTELAFYVGCLNLDAKIKSRGQPLCFPVIHDAQERKLSGETLYDICLLLTSTGGVEGNDPEANDKDLIIVTGRNTGGKSTFLRSVGITQLMMQAGMFVPAQSYTGSLCDGLITHFKREEDTKMESGKFDEELRRMDSIVAHIRPHSLLLSNESFASTNEREGSEIGRQVFSALLQEKVRIVAVTHMYELAQSFYEEEAHNYYFLRAEREGDGARSFKLIVGEPLRTSFGEDLYNKFFLDGSEAVDEPVLQEE
jgi:hypothetical protein